ncbi:MAG: glutaredoxin family protein [Fidelibacterota bacterium]
MNIKIYSTSWCGPCRNAKRLLTEKGLTFTEIDIEENNLSREDLFELTGGRSVPQIVIDKKPIGGFNELQKLFLVGELLN